MPRACTNSLAVARCRPEYMTPTDTIVESDLLMIFVTRCMRSESDRIKIRRSHRAGASFARAESDFPGCNRRVATWRPLQARHCTPRCETVTLQSRRAHQPSGTTADRWCRLEAIHPDLQQQWGWCRRCHLTKVSRPPCSCCSIRSGQTISHRGTVFRNNSSRPEPSSAGGHHISAPPLSHRHFVWRPRRRFPECWVHHPDEIFISSPHPPPRRGRRHVAPTPTRPSPFSFIG